MSVHGEDTTEGYVFRMPGKHKIFLGAAPGVGKTYDMLSEAHRRLARGEDVVIGIVETHGRQETAKLVPGLPAIPRKQLEYRGKIFEELDTAAIIARHPEWVLVDELAHTNVPGTVHEKRYQSVQEILSAGINVLSTVNVQHLESLNDTVFGITGVRVRETVPDSIVDQADEVVLVDATPDALINRLQRGEIYEEAKIPQALHNFFRKGNLTALRELALRTTADEVDESLEEYMALHNIKQVWATQERVMVCLTHNPLGEKLIRRGHTLAKRLKGVCIVLYVKEAGVLTNLKQQEQLKILFKLASELGAEVVEISGEDLSEEIIAFAKERKATYIVMGQSQRSRLHEIMHGSTINRIMRETKNIDVVIVADTDNDSTK